MKGIRESWKRFELRKLFTEILRAHSHLVYEIVVLSKLLFLNSILRVGKKILWFYYFPIQS